MKKPSKKLINLLNASAKQAEKFKEANCKFVDQFEKEYGHRSISDHIVQVSDYGGFMTENEFCEFCEKDETV